MHDDKPWPRSRLRPLPPPEGMRALMALQMFGTAQRIVPSSLDPGLTEAQRRRELFRRFHGDELADAVIPETRAAAAGLRLSPE